MRNRLFTILLLLLALSLTACGAKTPPSDETDPPAEDPALSAETEAPPAGDPALSPLEGVPLTEEELAQANEAFNCYGQSNDKALELSCFFTSSYEDVTELDLEEFLRYYFVDNSELEDTDAEEFQALAALPGFPFDAEQLEAWGNRPSGLPVPVHRIPRAAVDKTLETCAGITTADLKNVDGVLYLPDYDAYYNFTSDYGPGWFEAAEGARDGDTVRLRSEPWEGRELTLREDDGQWRIQSFTQFSAEGG